LRLAQKEKDIGVTQANVWKLLFETQHTSNLRCSIKNFRPQVKLRFAKTTVN
jgi:hypothetical protein